MKARIVDNKPSQVEDKPKQAENKSKQADVTSSGLTPEANYDRLAAMSDSDFEAMLRNAFGS